MATTPLPFPQESTGSVGPAAPLPAGTTVAHLTIERVLHEGLHNVVYLARDPNAQALALMEYFPRALALRQPDGSVRARQAGDAIALSVGREAFVLDANTLERIQHPGIVRVLGSLQAHRTVYRAMEYIDGPTLEHHIATRGPAASAGAVVGLLEHLLDALDALHRAGVVHGCVRPDQILMAPGERPVLLGMGSAGAEIVGHEAGPWSAPEQAAMSRHDRINSATDLYMAAATAWCFATGDTPPALRERLADPDAWDPAAALAELPEAAGDPPGTRARLAATLSAALALLPSERPQRVADLRRLLRPGAAPAAAADPDGTVPLWVGTMPDRDQQWEVFEKEVVLGGRAREAAPVPSAPATDIRPRSHRVHDDEAAEEAHAVGARGPRGWWIALPVLALVVVVGAIVVWSTSRDAAALRATLSSGPVLAEPGASASAPPPVAVPALPGVTPSPAPPSVAADPVVRAAPTVPPVTAPPVVAPPLPRAPVAAPVPSAAPAPPLMPAPRVTAASPAPRPAAPAAPASPRAACGNRSQFALLYCMQDQCSKPALRNHPQCNELRRSGDIQ